MMASRIFYPIKKNESLRKIMVLIGTKTIMNNISISPCGLKSNTNWLEVQTNGMDVWIVYVCVDKNLKRRCS